ncbi:hypothetical protein WG617_02770 [Mycoplasmopsis felifaucium]|uniref:Uncharacterized protein n=1 Tax=Mycoplasmopsis felifaucium TaxID=35768 RepID=A0ABZ2RPG5_9BACT
MRVNELINKAKVSKKYFLDNKIKINQKFFEIVIKKIFILQLVSLIAIIIGVSLIFVLVFNTIAELNLLSKNRKMFISHIIISSISILIPTIIAIFVLNYFNKIKKGIDKWIEMNQTFDEFKADTMTAVKQSHYFEKTCFLVFFDHENKNKGYKFNNKNVLKWIKHKHKNLKNKLYYSIILAYNTTTINNQFYSFNDLYNEYKIFCENNCYLVGKE